VTGAEPLETNPVAGATECPYCGRPFAREKLLALHCGHAHAEKLTDEEQSAFEAAFEDERTALRRFRLKALGALVVLYFGFLLVYALV